MRLSIVIPVYNERRWLEPFWKQLRSAPLAACGDVSAVEIIVVDDGSTDGTTEFLQGFCQAPFRFDCGTTAELKFLPQHQNQGKGAAVRRGIKATTGDIVLLQDADLEYSPKDYPSLIAPFLEHGAQAVFGSRFVGHPRRVLYFWHSVVNKLLTALSNMLNDLNTTDMETGYKVFSGDLIRRVRLTSNRFGIEPELVARLARTRCAIYEVPIRYQGRTYLEGKKIGVKDGIAALFHILRFGLWDRRPYERTAEPVLHTGRAERSDLASSQAANPEPGRRKS